MLKKELIQQVKQLQSDIRELVLNPNSERSIGIKIQTDLEYSIESALMQGMATTVNSYSRLLNSHKSDEETNQNKAI